MIWIAVCDDAQMIAAGVKKILEKHMFSESVTVDDFDNGNTLYESVLQKKYDILMMDVELTNQGFSITPNENGMLLADLIKDYSPNVIVIFFSQYLQYQKELLRHEPFGFVEKPLKEKELVEIVERAILRLRRRERNETTYQIKSVQGIVHQIKLKDILYIESQRPRVKVVMFGDELLSRRPLDEVEGELKELSPDFIRVNKSFLVNHQHVREYSSKTVVMMNGTEISIGRKYREDFKEKMPN